MPLDPRAGWTDLSSNHQRSLALIGPRDISSLVIHMASSLVPVQVQRTGKRRIVRDVVRLLKDPSLSTRSGEPMLRNGPRLS